MADQLQVHLLEDSAESSQVVVRSKKPVADGNELPLPYAAKKRKKVVLEEEEYIYALESIIERDFFPDSATMRDHIQLLEEYEKGSSLETLSRIKNKILADQRNFGATPNVFQVDTGGTVDGEENISRTGVDPALTVDDFFRHYNSEDNDSFEKLHEQDLLERRRKLHWMYESEDAGKRAGMLMWYHSGGKVLTAKERDNIDKLLEYPATFGDDRPNGVDTWRFRVRNQLMFPPELEASRDTCYLPTEDDPAARARRRQLTIAPSSSSDTLSGSSSTQPLLMDTEFTHMIENGDGSSELIEKQSMGRISRHVVATSVQTEGQSRGEPSSMSRPGGVDGTRNLSMPPPASVPSTLSHRHISAAQMDLDRKYTGGTIQHRNTRLRGAFLQDAAGASSDHSLRTPSGTSPVEPPHTPSSYADSEMGSSAGDINGDEGRGNYRTVTMTPSPMPGALIDEDRRALSPLMTWGEICGTPVALDAALVSASSGDRDLVSRRGVLDSLTAGIDTSGMSDAFHMSGLATREALAHKLEEKVRSKKKQHQYQQHIRKEADRTRLLNAYTPLGSSSLRLTGASPRTETSASGPAAGGRTRTKPASTPLTPAGMALAQKLAASTHARSGSLGLGSVLRSTAGTRGHPPSHFSDKAGQQRGAAGTTSGRSRSSSVVQGQPVVDVEKKSSATSLTDDLLQF